MPATIDRPAITTATGPFRRDPRTLRMLPPLRSVPGKVRLVKDLLRVGKWPVGSNGAGGVEWWDVDEATLADIARVFTAQKAAGQTRPLQWGHVDPNGGTMNTDARNVIDYWDSLFAEAGTLWGAIYVTDAVAADLTSVARPVSVGVDHRGTILTPGMDVAPVKNALIHVAVVDQGAMPGQGPFVQMGFPRLLAANTPRREPTRRESILAIRDRYQRRHG
jgi:hypothetical protein